MGIELISTNEYQDCFRIQNGFLFVVNKFVIDDVGNMGRRYKIPKNYYRKINKGVKDDLWSLVKPVKYWYWGIDENGKDSELENEFPIGTVFYNQKPVIKMDDPKWWDCYTRVAWDYNHGGCEYWLRITKIINGIMQRYKDRYENQSKEEIE